MLTISETIKHQIDLELFKKSISNDIAKRLIPLIDDLSASLGNIDGSKKATNEALVSVNKAIDEAFYLIETELLELIRDWLKSEVDWVADKEQMPVTDEDNQIIVAGVLASLVRGKTTERWLRDIAASLKSKIRANVLAGQADNLPLGNIIKSIVGTKANKRKDGVFDRLHRDITSITATSIQNGSVKARVGVWENNDIKKYRWISVLDSRTTAICRSRSNKVYVLGEGPLPPAHIKCRSTISRYSPDDVVPTSYDEWLRAQPIPVIVDILGKAKAALYLNGKITLDSYVTPAGRELTLKEIKSKLARSQ